MNEPTNADLIADVSRHVASLAGEIALGLLAQRLEAAETRIRELKTRQPTSIERAVEVLNEREHRASKDWILRSDGDISFARYGNNGPIWEVFILSAFEAVAIAEKYERDSL